MNLRTTIPGRVQQPTIPAVTVTHSRHTTTLRKANAAIQLNREWQVLITSAGEARFPINPATNVMTRAASVVSPLKFAKGLFPAAHEQLSSAFHVAGCVRASLPTTNSSTVRKILSIRKNRYPVFTDAICTYSRLITRMLALLEYLAMMRGTIAVDLQCRAKDRDACPQKPEGCVKQSNTMKSENQPPGLEV